MKLLRHNASICAMLLGCLLTAVTSSGCQTVVGGQTLPSENYLFDDVQFFPAGPEFILSRQEQAMERYRLEAEALNEDLQGDVP